MAGGLLALLALAACVAAARGRGGALAVNEGQVGYFGSGHDAGQQAAPSRA